MFEILYTKDFLKNAKKIPDEMQNKLADCLEYFRENPFYPLLHTKPLAGNLAGLFSFRIARDWRVIFILLIIIL